jgi:hypothetical protein
MRTIPIATAGRRSVAPCSCAAYRFPHRAGSGACTDPGPEPASCRDCSFSYEERDPYGTGDRWYSLTECGNDNGCPWGKE